MRRAVLAVIALLLSYSSAAACVGKTLVIGATESPESRVVAQVIAILINERTGTSVKIQDFPDGEEIHRALATGSLDIAVERTDQALERLGLGAAADAQAAYLQAKAGYLERLNLVWLPPLGPAGGGAALAAPVVRKDTVKKFPALPRLIAKTEGLLSADVVAALTRSGEPARSARQFLREKKLI